MFRDVSAVIAIITREDDAVSLAAPVDQASEVRTSPVARGAMLCKGNDFPRKLGRDGGINIVRKKCFPVFFLIMVDSDLKGRLHRRHRAARIDDKPVL